MKQLERFVARWMLAIGAIVSICTASAAETQARSLQGKVVSVGQTYGNLDTDIKLPTITLGQPLSVSCKEHTVEAVFVTGYADVASGEWLALENEDGLLQIAISYGDASEELNCAAGDVITVTVEAPVNF